MSLDYLIYNTNGKLITSERYAGMPFFYNEENKYIEDCAVKFSENDIHKIDDWSIDKNSNLWKEVVDNKNFIYYEENDNLLYYISKENVIEMQKLMSCNKILLEELMNENNSDGLIIKIF